MWVTFRVTHRFFNEMVGYTAQNANFLQLSVINRVTHRFSHSLLPSPWETTHFPTLSHRQNLKKQDFFRQTPVLFFHRLWVTMWVTSKNPQFTAGLRVSHIFISYPHFVGCLSFLALYSHSIKPTTPALF